MGMSASQARLLSLTARMHDLEFEAQGIQYSKLDLVDLKDVVYERYLDALDSTKIEMSVFTADGGNIYQDITYTNMLISYVNGRHSMYMLTNNQDQILLPEQIASKLQEMPDSLDEFLQVVARNYLYTGRSDLSDEDIIKQMREDGNYEYWKSIFHQIIGFSDDNGNIINGRGFCPISKQNAADREWLEEALNSGEVRLYRMTQEETIIDTDTVNIFAETSVATDPTLREVTDNERIQKATVEYEQAIKDLDAKETKFDIQLAKIDQEHNALKTEYDSVKQIVSKNIDRSFKSFNA